MTYNRILVGTDGSERSERAVHDAAALARATGAQLVIAAAYHHGDAPTDDDIHPDSWMVTSARGAEDQIIRAREIAAHIGVESGGRAVPGDKPGVALLETAEDVEADLIVVGNKGMTGAKRFLLGSVPDFISHHADCDVLIAHTSD